MFFPEFDTPFTVTEDHKFVDATNNVYAPEVYLDNDNGIEVPDSNWSALTSFSGQHGYNGAVMHPSETFSGGLAEHVRSTPGTYVVVEVSDLEDPDAPVGWVTLTLADRVSKDTSA